MAEVSCLRILLRAPYLLTHTARPVIRRILSNDVFPYYSGINLRHNATEC